jgi:protein-S-isoprenylcysteine O-methyltransferase Ste14
MLIAAYALQRNVVAIAVHVIQSAPLAIVFIVAGIALAAWGERTFAAAGTEIMPASATNKKLVASGPFRFTRNPMYLGLILASLGVAFYFGTLPFFVVPVLVFLLCNFVFIPFEEAKMLRQHSDQYTEYLARVRRWV